MPVFVFASPKGGAGKSTSVFCLASQLAKFGGTVCVIDADPNQALSYWATISDLKNNKDIRNIEVVGMEKGELLGETIVPKIVAASKKFQFVLVDLEGTASQANTKAIRLANFCVVTSQGSPLDAREAVKTIQFIDSQEINGRKIPYALVFTRTGTAVKTRTFSAIEADFVNEGTKIFKTQINERDAYRAIFSYGGTLETLNPKLVPNVEAAINNAGSFAAELIELYKESQQQNDVEAAE